ncbi:MAG TPA: LPS export ABC transporter ATP-binding protein [Candidatus Krumholzibacteria bacterium]|nr:LPS export ABC transporter ATP-binding protein [Candidatus Krumholzibacteria bacterium]
MARKSLSCDALAKVYRSRRVVDGVRLQVETGEVVGLLGPNGAGKTTTFYMIVGFIKPAAGRVYLDDEDISRLPMYKRARRGIGYLPQEASIFRRMTVEDNVRAILETMTMSKSEREDRCDQLLEELGVSHIRKSRGFQLSGGERRRVEIARALATEPAFILLDEPFAGIDPIAVQDIQTIVGGLKDRGLGVLITDHNVHETLSITDRAYILHEGRIAVSGTPEEIVADEDARRIYLGESFRLERA